MSAVIRTTSILAVSAWMAAMPLPSQPASAPWADPGLVSINQRPPGARLDPLGPAEDRERWRLNLNGGWRFLLLADAANLPPDLDASLASGQGWASIQVPGSWQEQGFGQTFLARNTAGNPVFAAGVGNATGVYVRDFTLPPGWGGRQVILRLKRARSSVSVRLNGSDVGYSENAEAAAEFDLTRFLVAASNRLTLIVTQWSTSSAHNGVHWTRTGLLDDIELLALPAATLTDYSAESRFDPDSGSGTLDLLFHLRSTQPGSQTRLRIETSLSDPAGEVVTRRFRRGLVVGAGGQTTATLRLQVADAVPWSPDSPSLYELEMQLLDAAGVVLQRSRIAIGFRSVEFSRGGLVVNGRPLTLRGVSLDADIAATATEREAVERHLRLMKQAGINALRVPVSLAPEWYELLDLHGFFTIHQLDPSLPGVAVAGPLERAMAMVEAAKNHPSTLAWVWRGGDVVVSADLRAWLRAHDRTHVVLPNRDTELIVKPRAWQFERRARNDDRLLLLWPFGTLLGNSGGGLDRFWRIVEERPRAIGGMLPRWMASVDPAGADDADPAGADAIARGLLNAEEQPLPAYGEVAALYRPLRFELVDAGIASFRLVNRSHSIGTGDSDGFWTLRRDGSVIAAGKLPRLGVDPGDSVDFRVPGLPPRHDPAEYHLSLELRSGSGDPQRLAPVTQAAGQFALPSSRPLSTETFAGEIPALALEEDGLAIELGTRDVTFRVDRTSGTLGYLSLRGRPLVDGVVLPSLWRLPTQQEKASGLADLDRRLRPVFTTPPADWVGRRVSPSSYSSVSEYTVLDEGVMRLQTTMFGTGAAELSLHWLGEPGTADPPRLGVVVPLDPRVVSVEWFGRGPGESYRNRLSGTEIGRWQLPLPLPNPYYWRQAHGLRTETRWATVWFVDGSGLLAVLPPTSSFTIAERDGGVFLELDVRHRGVVGERDDAIPARRARVPPGEYRATFLLLPVPAGSDPQALFRNVATSNETAAALQSPVRPPAWSLAHLGRGQPLNLVESDADAPPTRRSVLNDGWIGSIDALDATWSPLDSLPAEITIDLERVETVRRLRLGVLSDPDACADLPAAVEFSYSTDRRRWVSLETLTPSVGTTNDRRQRLWLNRDLLGRPVRWVRARILDPETTCATGEPNRVLVDELVVE